MLRWRAGLRTLLSIALFFQGAQGVFHQPRRRQTPLSSISTASVSGMVLFGLTPESWINLANLSSAAVWEQQPPL